jgi:hypothetical protein
LFGRGLIDARQYDMLSTVTLWLQHLAMGWAGMWRHGAVAFDCRRAGACRVCATHKHGVLGIGGRRAAPARSGAAAARRLMRSCRRDRRGPGAGTRGACHRRPAFPPRMRPSWPACAPGSIVCPGDRSNRAAATEVGGSGCGEIQRSRVQAQLIGLLTNNRSPDVTDLPWPRRAHQKRKLPRCRSGWLGSFGVSKGPGNISSVSTNEYMLRLAKVISSTFGKITFATLLNPP